MSIALARTIHRLVTDPQFRAQLATNPELTTPASQSLSAEDRDALLEAIAHTPPLAATLHVGDGSEVVQADWPVNASFTAAAIA